MADATTFLIEQALFAVSPAPSYTEATQATIALQARSDGFAEDWLPLAEELIRGFGEQPVGIACPLAIFAQPFGIDHVAIVRVTDRSNDGGQESLPHALLFHFLIVPRREYERYLGDPFHLARQLPVAWHASGTLPAHGWPRVPMPRRTVAQVQNVLKRLKPVPAAELENAIADHQVLQGLQRPEGAATAPKPPDKRTPTVENSESPFLLGGAQLLVDGGKLYVRRSGPDAELVEGLWTLLPDSTRCRLWPASFAFSNELQFDVLVVPRVLEEDFEYYTSEEGAKDYPEGRYELHLQMAAERGDQDEINALLSRRSSHETLQLAVRILCFLVAMFLLFAILDKTIFKPAPRQAPPDLHLRAATAASIVANGDPWSAITTGHLGTMMFSKPANP